MNENKTETAFVAVVELEIFRKVTLIFNFLHESILGTSEKLPPILIENKTETVFVAVVELEIFRKVTLIFNFYTSQSWVLGRNSSKTTSQNNNSNQKK